ncbi:uncharacterized protein LOC142325070 isoform X3 [Lycorma delicatula]|uniref:uncharacterized protein LOC142325070 isoform X3 n=1 Tax=Lycorma delicatula TaxID=130591 RepID=UPI003F5110E3
MTEKITHIKKAEVMDSCSGKNVLLQKSELFKKELEKLMKHGETLENEVKKLINKLNETNDPVEYRVSYYKTLKHFDILIDRVVEINCNIELEPLPDPLKNGVQILNIPHLPVINKKHQMNYIDGENPWNFWLTYADKEEFESFSASLWEKFSKGSMEPYNMKPICGDYVCFQEGMKVRRAVIINNHQRDRVKVLDVDNGSVKLLKVQKLFKVDEEIILLHAQALNCYLSEKTDDIHLWSPEVQRIFSGTLRCNKLTVEVVNKRNDIPPSFLVNITAVEYGSFVGGVDVGDCSETCINEWVLDRLLPELRNNTLNCQLSILALDAFCFTNDMQSDILNEEMCKNGFIDSSKECDIIEEESEKSSDSLHSNFKKQENKVEHISASSQLKQSSGGASCIVNNVMRTAGSGSEKKFVASEESNILQTTTRASVCSQLGDKVKLKQQISLINPEEELKAMISCIVSPDEIYVHLANTNNVEIDNMEAEMNKHYAEAHHVLMSSKAEAKTLIGRYCACYCRIDLPYNNDHYSLKWYRAEILNWDKDGDILVYLVDHGNKLKVKLFQLQPLLPLFTKFYTMAQRCHLSAVKRPEDGWPDKVIKTLSRFVSLHKAYTLMVVPSSASNSLEVVLYENNDRSCTINSKLLEFMQMYAENKDEELEVDKEKEVEVEKYLKDDDHGGGGGVSDDDGVGGDDDDGVGGDDDDDDDDDEEEEEEDVGKIIEEWNPMEEDFESARNNYKYDDQDPCVAVSGYAPKDEERNCKFFSKFGRCWKKSCQLKHVEVSPGVFTTDKEEVYHQAFNKLILPSKGSVIKLKVTNVTGPNRFFVQVAGNVIGYENGGDSDEKETLSSLMTHLNKPCNVKQLEPLGYSLAGGQLVIVKVEVDGKECFLRARVSEVFDDDTYSVFYCDFGTQDLVSLKNIREVQPKYLHLPFQAVECSLANVELKDSEIGKYEPISKLKELIEGRRLSAMVHKSFQELQHLEIFLEDEKSNDISEQLVESGYYIFIKSDDDNDKNNYHPG